jgi:hypothetical protein
MTYTHLVPKRSKSSIHFHFRSKIPKDLISYFNETKQFQISLNNVRKRETLLLSLTLKYMFENNLTPSIIDLRYKAGAALNYGK